MLGTVRSGKNGVDLCGLGVSRTNGTNGVDGREIVCGRVELHVGRIRRHEWLEWNVMCSNAEGPATRLPAIGIAVEISTLR